MTQIHLLAPVLLKFYPRCDSDKKKNSYNNNNDDVSCLNCAFQVSLPYSVSMSTLQ